MVFRSVTVRGVPKGHVEFCGVAVLEWLEHVVQRDPAKGTSFAYGMQTDSVHRLTAAGILPGSNR